MYLLPSTQNPRGSGTLALTGSAQGAPLGHRGAPPYLVGKTPPCWASAKLSPWGWGAAPRLVPPCVLCRRDHLPQHSEGGPPGPAWPWPTGLAQSSLSPPRAHLVSGSRELGGASSVRTGASVPTPRRSPAGRGSGPGIRFWPRDPWCRSSLPTRDLGLCGDVSYHTAVPENQDY